MFRDQSRQYKQYEDRVKSLKTEKMAQSLYFFSRKILFSYINSDDAEIRSIFLGKTKVKIVTGFGLTGSPHIGTKIIRDELLYFLKLKFKVFVCLSEADAINRGTTAFGKRKSLFAINLFFKRVFNNKNFFLVDFRKSKRLSYKLAWSDTVARKIFKKIFGQISSTAKESALFDMAKNILGISVGIEKGKKCVVIMGIDELNNALFVGAVAKALKYEVPIFLFNKIIPGYGVPKMGKSVPEKSFIFYSNFFREYRKAEKYFGKNHHKEGAKCSLCDIVFFSGYEIDLKQKNIIKFIHQNSKVILKDIFKNL